MISALFHGRKTALSTIATPAKRRIERALPRGKTPRSRRRAGRAEKTEHGHRQKTGDWDAGWAAGREIMSFEGPADAGKPDAVAAQSARSRATPAARA
jgi:hypothetical protein